MTVEKIIFKCKDNAVIKDLELEAYELDFYIFVTIQNLKKLHKGMNPKDIVICIHPQVLDFLIYSDFNHIKLENTNNGVKYTIYGHKTLVTTDCFLRIMVDITHDIVEETDYTCIKYK